jgi:hypothetical protein
MLAAIALAAALDAQSGGGGAVNLVDPPVDQPRFVERPTAAQVLAAYPHGAANLGASGHATIHCQIGDKGKLEHCAAVREFPAGLGFGTAAIALARYYRVDPASPGAASGELDLPMDFATSLKEDETLVAGPWIAAPSFAEAGEAYPDIGGGAAGEAELHCALTGQGALRACKLLYVQPLDRDFDKSALKLAASFRMQVDPALARTHQALGANLAVRLPAPFGEEFKAHRITDPTWLALPSEARMAALFPAAASAKALTAGTGLADCDVGADGSLQNCRPSGDGDPPGVGFSDAAAKAAAEMRMSPWSDAGGPVAGASVRVSLRFTAPAH